MASGWLARHVADDVVVNWRSNQPALVQPGLNVSFLLGVIGLCICSLADFIGNF
jgi:hypothetical protein